MPGRIKEAPAVAKFRLSFDPVDRENPLHFSNARETLEWLKPLESKPDAITALRALFRRDAKLGPTVDQSSATKIIADLAAGLASGAIVYQIQQKGGGGAGGGGGGGSANNNASSSNSQSSSSSSSAPGAAGPPPAGSSAKSASPGNLPGLQFDPAPPAANPDPLQTPPPGPGRETAGNTH